MRPEERTEMHPVSAAIEADVIGKPPAAGNASTTGIASSALDSIISGKVSHRLQLPVLLPAF
jgi:hypothetical protein